MLSSNEDIAILKGEHPVTRYLDRSAQAHAIFLPRDEIRIARLLGILVALSAFLISFAVQARGTPDSFADLAEALTPAVVNISTAQSVRSPQAPNVMPQVPPGSPFEDLFRDFFERQQRGDQEQKKRRVTSLGSGFIVDASGYVVTVWMRTPSHPRFVRPNSRSWVITGPASAEGTAKPMPTLPPDGEKIAVLMPITLPSMLNRGPPELPRLIGASVCKKSS